MLCTDTHANHVMSDCYQARRCTASYLSPSRTPEGSVCVSALASDVLQIVPFTTQKSGEVIKNLMSSWTFPWPKENDQPHNLLSHSSCPYLYISRMFFCPSFPQPPSSSYPIEAILHLLLHLLTPSISSFPQVMFGKGSQCTSSTRVFTSSNSSLPSQPMSLSVLLRWLMKRENPLHPTSSSFSETFRSLTLFLGSLGTFDKLSGKKRTLELILLYHKDATFSYFRAC